LRKLTLAIALAALASAPTLAHGQATSRTGAGESPETEQEIEKGFEMSSNYFLKKFKGSEFTYETAIGSGTFVRNPYGDNPYVANNFYFQPRFNFTKNLVLSVRWAFTVEYTQPDATGGNGTQSIRRFDPFDTWFTFYANNLFKRPLINNKTTLTLGAYGRLIAPTSYASQFRGEIFDLSAGGNVKWNLFKRVTLTYDFRVTKYLQRGGAYTVSADAAPKLGIQCRDGEEICAANNSGQNPNVGIVNTFGVNVDITKKLSAGVNLLVIKTWDYPKPIDGFSAANAIATGGSDSTWGFISVEYAILKHLSVAAGLWSYQPFFNKDNKSGRFPFFDFSSPNNNYSNFFIDLTARL
jgi:hypothetical protein